MQRLCQRGHRLEDIKNYTIHQFTMLLAAVEQVDASDRTAFVTDVSVVLSSLLAGKGANPSKEHLTLLTETVVGVRHGGQQT